VPAARARAGARRARGGARGHDAAEDEVLHGRRLQLGLHAVGGDDERGVRAGQCRQLVGLINIDLHDR